MSKEQFAGLVVDFKEPFYKPRHELERYEAILGVSRNMMCGKEILDIGLSVPFMIDCVHNGLSVTAVRNGRDDTVGEDLGKRVKPDKVDALSFDNDTFDLVLANSSVPLCVKNGETFDLVLSFYQMLRVCKPGGVVAVSPMPTVATMTLDRCLDMGDLTYPYKKKWPINLVELFCRCGIRLSTHPCKGPYEGQFAVHFNKKEKSDLTPMIDWMRMNRPGNQG